MIEVGISAGGSSRVVVLHPDGMRSVCVHMREVDPATAGFQTSVQAGDWVQKGQILGEMGNYGAPLGVHLH